MRGQALDGEVLVSSSAFESREVGGLEVAEVDLEAVEVVEQVLRPAASASAAASSGAISSSSFRSVVPLFREAR